MPYAELCHYEFTSRGREETSEEKATSLEARTGPAHATLAGVLPRWRSLVRAKLAPRQ